MQIQVVAGTGVGPTKLAAFDAALNTAGVANYNLIKLSSIIPESSRVLADIKSVRKQPGHWGDRLYVVMADMRVDTPNVEAWAGIGWVQERATGRGLFVEHKGANEKTVRRDIRQTLQAMMETRKEKFGPVHMKVIGKTCLHEPVCSLVIAVYEAQNWQ